MQSHWAAKAAKAAAERREAMRQLRRARGNVRVLCRLRPAPLAKALAVSTISDGEIERGEQLVQGRAAGAPWPPSP